MASYDYSGLQQIFLSHSLEKDEILADVASRLWFTYRKNFPAIGEYRLLQRVL